MLNLLFQFYLPSVLALCTIVSSLFIAAFLAVMWVKRLTMGLSFKKSVCLAVCLSIWQYVYGTCLSVCPFKCTYVKETNLLKFNFHSMNFLSENVVSISLNNKSFSFFHSYCWIIFELVIFFSALPFSMLLTAINMQ